MPLSDAVLCAAIEEMVSGLIDADLGGHVYKKRVAVAGRGKRGGARTILGSNLGDRWFFLYGFEKNERADIDTRELAGLQLITRALLAMDEKVFGKALAEGEITEICHEEAASSTR